MSGLQHLRTTFISTKHQELSAYVCIYIIRWFSICSSTFFIYIQSPHLSLFNHLSVYYFKTKHVPVPVASSKNKKTFKSPFLELPNACSPFCLLISGLGLICSNHICCVCLTIVYFAIGREELKLTSRVFPATYSLNRTEPFNFKFISGHFLCLL